jgi:hypothetical protein
VASKKRARRPVGPIGDVALVCGKDEHGLHLLRRRSEDSPLEAAIAQPLTEGRPITGEVISMRRREDAPLLFDVKTELDAPVERSGDGPAQVASESYRKGWDAIWGRAAARDRAN